MKSAFLGAQNRMVQLGHFRKAALYCRVSTGDQSCERQERDLRAFAEWGDFEIIAVFKETASGNVNSRSERKKVMMLARDRQIEAVLVTELTRWDWSTTDLLHTLQELESCGVSVIAQTRLQFALRSPQGKLFASLMAALAEFERDLLRERIRSGISAAQEKGMKFGRQEGQRPKAAREEAKVLKLQAEGKPYQVIASELHLSKNTVMDIMKRNQWP